MGCCLFKRESEEGSGARDEVKLQKDMCQSSQGIRMVKMEPSEQLWGVKSLSHV